MPPPERQPALGVWSRGKIIIYIQDKIHNIIVLLGMFIAFSTKKKKILGEFVHSKSWQMGKTVMFLICRICFNLPNTKLVLPLVSGSLLSLIATVPSLCPQPLQLHRRNGAKSRIFHYWIKHLGEKWASINAILLLIMIFQWHIIKLFLFIYF